MVVDKDLRERLRRLQFPDKVVEEMMEAKEKGWFDMQPSSDLPARLQQACRSLQQEKPVTQ